ncbi:MAG: polyhydroxybutyrate depolymerase [Alphaproteobacteria bacterium]|nr:polyhydroxybutyrate depolymerase [Alphaproteobacteria bacterium]
MTRFSVFFLVLCVLWAPVHALRESPSERMTMTHDGVERYYTLHVPPRVLGSKKKVPLVLMLHGGGGNDSNGVKMSQFSKKADAEGFIVAYPSGSGRFKKVLKTWNFWHCCGYAMENNTDDAGFLNALIDHLVENYPVDPDRVLVTGMSNGAMMSHRTGIELSGKVAAIAPVVGTVFGDEPRAKGPVAAFIINGTADKHIKMDGGKNVSRIQDAWDGTPMKPALWQSEYWAKRNGCKPKPEKIQYKKDVILYDYHCPQGKDVRHMIIEGGGHSWPGGRAGRKKADAPSQALNATDEMWAFFMEMTE